MTAAVLLRRLVYTAILALFAPVLLVSLVPYAFITGAIYSFDTLRLELVRTWWSTPIGARVIKIRRHGKIIASYPIPAPARARRS